MKKVIITGANGFAGKHLVRELLSNNYEVLAIGGSQKPGIDMPADAEYITLDLTDPSEVERIDFTEVSGLVNLAGMTSVGDSFGRPLPYMTINFGIEINLFETALKQGAKLRFLIVSSGMIYDPKVPQPLTENSPVLPNSPYAVSKLGQEQLAQYYALRGFECIIARPFNHVGPGQAPGFIFPDLAQQIVCAERGQQAEILVGNLDARRDYTDVRDIARAYRLLLEKGQSGELYNICSGRSLSGHDVLDGLLSAAGIQPEIKQDPDRMRPSDTPVLYGDYSKLTTDTGWQPEISLETTFADVIEDWRSKL